jgi:hypothetical protein
VSSIIHPVLLWRGASRRRRFMALAALAALLAVLIPVTQLMAGSKAHASTQIISCSNGSGTAQFSPAITYLAIPPVLSTSVANKGPMSAGSCQGILAGAGVTGAGITFAGQLLAPVCVTTPLGDQYLAAEGTGQMTFTWSGGPYSGQTTTYSWVVVGAIEVTPTVSAVTLAGTYDSGAYPGSVFAIVAQAGTASPDCAQGTRTFSASLPVAITISI